MPAADRMPVAVRKLAAVARKPAAVVRKLVVADRMPAVAVRKLVVADRRAVAGLPVAVCRPAVAAGKPAAGCMFAAVARMSAEAVAAECMASAFLQRQSAALPA